MGSRRVDPAHRFWQHVRKDDSGCWIWTATLAQGSGYGLFNRGGGLIVGAHCFAWELANPSLTREGHVVRHTCDTPACVNPQHLEIGSHADNSRDMDERGRRVNNPARGESHYKAKLTREIVRRARRMHAQGASVASIARAFGVAAITMDNAIKRKTWKD